MSLDVLKVKDECWAYWSLIDMIEKGNFKGLYGVDEMRQKQHDDLCAAYGLKKEETKVLTDHIDKFETGYDLHVALMKLKGGES